MDSLLIDTTKNKGYYNKYIKVQLPMHTIYWYDDEWYGDRNKYSFIEIISEK